MDLDVVFLGTSASAPTARRGTSSLLLRRGGDRLLLDCGEGTQRQLLRSTVGLVDLEHVFLTHLHADHYLGLPGMLKTFSLRTREPALHVYGPPGLRELFGVLARVIGRLSFELELVELRGGDAVPLDGYQVCAFPVSHGVPSIGYALVEPERPGRFDDARADALGVPFGPERGVLQRGEPVTLEDGRVVSPSELVGPARPGRTIAYTGDTAPTEAVSLLFPGADVLIHEATFGNDDVERAVGDGPFDRAAGGGGRGGSRGVAARAHPRLAALLRARAAPGGTRRLRCNRSPARLRHDRGSVPGARRARPREGRREARATRGRGDAGGVTSGFDARAARYEELRPIDANWWEVYEALVRLGSLRGKRVLEVGCGTGRLSHELEQRDLARVWAVDASEAMVERAKALGVNARVARAEALPFKAGWFDAVVMRMALHLFDRPRALEQAARVLGTGRKPGGRDRGSRQLRRRLVHTLLPVRPRDRARAFPRARSSSARSSRRPGSAGSRSSTSASIASRPASARVDLIRSKGFSTFDLLDPAEFEEGLARAEAELPDRFEFTFDWLLVAAT